MLSFLQNLPEEYWIYREVQENDSYDKQVRGEQKKQPDSVVVAPQVGVLSYRGEGLEPYNETIMNGSINIPFERVHDHSRKGEGDVLGYNGPQKLDSERG